MRIVSPFTDYYDFVAKRFGGGDPRIVYSRQPLTQTNPKLPGHPTKDVKVTNFHMDCPSMYERRYCKKGIYQYYCKYLVVVGKAYLLRWKVPYEEGVLQYTNSVNNYSIHDTDKDNTVGLWWFRKAHEFGIEYPFLVDACRKVGAPVFVINKVHFGGGPYVSKEEDTLEIDGQCPLLGKVGMAAIIDPYQMYQELAVFVGNKMKESPDMKPPVELDNKQRILKAGFDLKTSFRHRV